jgi:hypothetical protein
MEILFVAASYRAVDSTAKFFDWWSLSQITNTLVRMIAFGM